MRILATLLLIPSLTLANSFLIEIDSTEGAPDLKDIVEPIDFSSWKENPPLQAFRQQMPSAVQYLMTERPMGNRKELINNNPVWSLSKLYRTIIVDYPSPVSPDVIQSSFANDEYISHYQQSSLISEIPAPKTNQIGRTPVNATSRFSNAWELSEGMGYVGAVDSGTQVEHIAFRAFDNRGVYQGGNLLDGHYQYDFQENDLNVDERQPYQMSAPACDASDGVPNDGYAAPFYVGHGTHVSGIIAGKGTVTGLCKNCGFSMFKFRGMKGATCSNGIANARVSSQAFISAWSAMGYSGVGAFNISAGFPSHGTDYCTHNSNDAECVALDFLQKQAVLVVGAGGNHKRFLQFPASAPSVVAAGGIDDNDNFWDEAPNCPFSGNDECGSNFSQGNAKTDVVTPAKNIYSTFYTGGEWSAAIGCTDAADGIANDGYGLCTGTSMSAPLVTAMLQLMRSANPLLPNGSQAPSALIGIRNVLNATASRTTAGETWDSKMGYGIPNPKKALEVILGKSNKKQMKTRLTPMFELKTVATSGGISFYNNHVYTPFPQVASAFLLHNGIAYRSDTSAPIVNEFTKFWYDHEKLANISGDLKPRAKFYVFTTNNNPFTNSKNMTPLRRMIKTTSNRNDTYAISRAEIESFHRNGFEYAGIEGYILPKCSPLPACQPNGSTRLYRNESDANNHRLLATNTPPSNSTFLGFVYLNQDSDNDGLIDGQEIILGTNPNNRNSDNDTMNDGQEYPPAGIPISDPLKSDPLIQDSFEAL